jgi:hypothetical protein
MPLAQEALRDLNAEFAVSVVGGLTGVTPDDRYLGTRNELPASLRWEQIPEDDAFQVVRS